MDAKQELELPLAPTLTDIESAERQVGTIETFDVDEFPPNEQIPGPDPTPEFIETVRKFGVCLPVVILRDVELNHLRDGGRRIKAARAVGIKQVRGIVFKDAGDLGLFLTLVLNAKRSDNPVSEFNAVRHLVERGYTKTLITQATGYPPAKIERMLRLGKLVPALLDAMAKGKIKPTLGEACAKEPQAVQERLAARLAKAGRLTMRDLAEERTARAKQSMSALPAMLFIVPTRAEADWRKIVVGRVEDALRAVPEGESAVRAALERALSELGG